jgi:hypothetical protein
MEHSWTAFTSTWHRALRKFGVEAPQWKIHSTVGMSGKLFLPKLLKELGHRSSPALVSRLESARAPLFAKLIYPALLPCQGRLSFLTFCGDERFRLPSQRAATAHKRVGLYVESPSSPTARS